MHDGDAKALCKNQFYYMASLSQGSENWTGIIPLLPLKSAQSWNWCKLEESYNYRRSHPVTSRWEQGGWGGGTTFLDTLFMCIPASRAMAYAYSLKVCIGVPSFLISGESLVSLLSNTVEAKLLLIEALWAGWSWDPDWLVRVWMGQFI